MRRITIDRSLPEAHQEPGFLSESLSKKANAKAKTEEKKKYWKEEEEGLRGKHSINQKYPSRGSSPDRRNREGASPLYSEGATRPWLFPLPSFALVLPRPVHCLTTATLPEEIIGKLKLKLRQRKNNSGRILHMISANHQAGLCPDFSRWLGIHSGERRDHRRVESLDIMERRKKEVYTSSLFITI